jgi:hypothetical protein
MFDNKDSKIGRTYDDLWYERSLITDTSGKSNRKQFMYTHEIDKLDIKPEKVLFNIQSKNVLNSLFFSKENVEEIQKRIIYEVYKKTQEKISRQNYNELIIIMRSVYLMNSRNLNYDIKNQISDLNDIVVAETVPIIVTNLKAHLQYMVDNQVPTRTMDRPQFVDSQGLRGNKTASALGF